MSLFADPDIAVAVDLMLERGQVRSIEVWTDEEAELCRVAAFRLGYDPKTHNRSRVDQTFELNGTRTWVWNAQIHLGGARTLTLATNERAILSWDPPDFSLDVYVEPYLARYMAEGREMPDQFKPEAAHG